MHGSGVALLEQGVPRAVLPILIQPSIHSITAFAFSLPRLRLLGMVTWFLAIPLGRPVTVTVAHRTTSGVTVLRVSKVFLSFWLDFDIQDFRRRASLPGFRSRGLGHIVDGGWVGIDGRPR